MTENSSCTRPKLLVFDIGGVLIFFDRMRACSRLEQYSALSAGEINELVVASGVEREFDRGNLTTGEFYREVKQLAQMEISRSEFVKFWTDVFTPNWDMIDLIAGELKGNYPLFVLSNINRLHFQFIADKFDILDWFDQCIVSYEVEAIKPEPPIYHFLSDKSGLEPSDHLFVDDQLENVEGARSLGWTGIHFDSFERFREELRDYLSLDGDRF